MRFTKKLLAMALTIALVLSSMPIILSANNVITITIDGQVVEFEDQAPIISGNAVLVPARFVFTDLGFVPSWSRSTQTATLTRSDYVIEVVIGSTEFMINGMPHALEVPAQMISGRVMIPLGAILRSVGYQTQWVGATRTARIVTPVLQEFLSYFDLDLVRDILGTDFHFTPMVEGATLRWSDLSLDSLPSVDADRANDFFPGNWFTQYGEAVLYKWIDYGYPHLLVDIGASGDFWDEYDEGMYRAYLRFDVGLVAPFSFDVLDEIDLDTTTFSPMLQLLNADRNIEYIRAAASDGDAIAQFVLGLMYDGWSDVVESDPDRVHELYLLSAEQGLARAMVNLAFSYIDHVGDEAKALAWMRQAAELGNPIAQSNLGIVYAHGVWTADQDFEQALYWLHLGAAEGRGNALATIGNLYYRGQGVEQCYETAAMWYRKAVESYLPPVQAFYNLAYLYFNGLGVDQCYETALYWFFWAHEYGHESAHEWIEYILEQME